MGALENTGLRRPHLSNGQRQAARMERCLRQTRSIHLAVPGLLDGNPADARDPRVSEGLYTAQPAAAPAAPFKAAEPVLQLTLEQPLLVVGIVSGHYRGTALAKRSATWRGPAALCPLQGTSGA